MMEMKVREKIKKFKEHHTNLKFLIGPSCIIFINGPNIPYTLLLHRLHDNALYGGKTALKN